MKKKIISASIILFSLPLVSFAEDLGATRKILEAGKGIIETLLIPIVFTLALLLFFWGIAKFIWQEGQGKEDGKKIMIWGVIALFVASSVWGLVRFIRENFGINEGNESIEIPGFKSGSGSGTNYYGPNDFGG